jgi:uncharacterized protein
VKMTLRLDAGTQGTHFKELSNGWLYSEAVPCKVGILTYHRDGKVIREFRPESEMFSEATLNSLRLLPVTLEHPEQPVLTAENTYLYQAGTVGDSIRREGNKVVQTIMITRKDAVDAVKSYTAVDLSLAYTCDIDNTPGEWRGIKYDAVQRNVKGNHVAITKKGRAGSECAIRLDSDDAGPGVVPSVAAKPDTTSDIAKFEIMTLQKEIASLKAELAVRRDSVPSVAAKPDTTSDIAKFEIMTLQKEIASLKAELAVRRDSVPLVDLEKVVASRIQLVEQAKKLAPAIRFDSLTELDIKTQAIQAVDKAYGELLKDKSPEFIDGVFQVLVRRDSASTVDIVRVKVPDNHFFATSDKQAQSSGPDLKASFEQAAFNAGKRKG